MLYESGSAGRAAGCDQGAYFHNLLLGNRNSDFGGRHIEYHTTDQTLAFSSRCVHLREPVCGGSAAGPLASLSMSL